MSWKYRSGYDYHIPRFEIHSLTYPQIFEVAEGVQYIHSQGIVHGDLRGVSIFKALGQSLTLPSLGECSTRCFFPFANH